MKPVLGILLVFVALFTSSSFCQDIKVREQAVLLLEHANAVSSSPKLPNLERVDTFRAYSEAGVQEGSFSRVVIQGVGRREEYNFGAFHLLNVHTQKQVAVAGSPKIVPAELMKVLQITPIWRGQFDDEDVIHAISDRTVGGAAARCIEFDTIQGQHTDNNEICVDAKTGAIVRSRLGGEVIENSEFFSFAGALYPGKISYARSSGTQKIEISQTMTVLDNADANVLASPPDAQIRKLCTTFRRAFGVSMPQPKAGNGAQADDVVVRAMVGVDGRVYDATVQDSDREDLNPEALGLAKQWTFTPAMCDGRANTQEVYVTLHFSGR